MASIDEDLNREILEKMMAGGDDLKMPRPIDFSHAFPDSVSATAFAKALRSRGFLCEIEETRCVPELPWDVVVSIEMVPECRLISEIEHDLGEVASYHSGRADVWGCTRVVGSSARE